jgi:hypothetical protein
MSLTSLLQAAGPLVAGALPDIVAAVRTVASAPPEDQAQLAARMLAAVASDRTERELAQALLDRRHGK